MVILLGLEQNNFFFFLLALATHSSVGSNVFAASLFCFDDVISFDNIFAAQGEGFFALVRASSACTDTYTYKHTHTHTHKLLTIS